VKNIRLIIAGIAIVCVAVVTVWLMSFSNGLEVTFDQSVKFDDQECRVRILKLVKPVLLEQGSPPLPKALEGYLGNYSKFNQPNLYTEEQLLQLLSLESRKSVTLEVMRERKAATKTMPNYFQKRVDYLILGESQNKKVMIVCKKFGPDYEKSGFVASQLIWEDAQWKVLSVLDPLMDLMTPHLNWDKPQDTSNFIRKEPLKKMSSW
jgi:hypothetical protein